MHASFLSTPERLPSDGTANPMPMQQSNEWLCDTESDLSEEAESELESDEISDDNDGF